jgi:hypothetical protein
VSDADSFGIAYSTKFESTYSRALRTHYRKNPTDLSEFEESFDKMETDMSLDPYLPGSVRMPWPGNFGRPDWDLCKLKFNMPGLKGASSLGRLLYLVDRKGKIIHLLWVYTHREYENQPPTKDIRRAVLEVYRHSEG